jgi:hypothetical protein
MTRDKALEDAMAACRQAQVVASEYHDIVTAQAASEALRLLTEAWHRLPRGTGKCSPP